MLTSASARTLLLASLLIVSHSFTLETQRAPMLFLHGIQDSCEKCWNPTIIPDLTSRGVVAICLDLYNDFSSHKNLWEQTNGYIQEIRRLTLNDKRFDDGYHLIGHSMGGLLARSIVELMDDHKVLSIVSMAGPQMGIFIHADENIEHYLQFFPQFAINFINDPNRTGKIVDAITSVVFSRMGQLFSFGNLWHSPVVDQYDLFMDHNVFFPILNNLKETSNDEADVIDFKGYGLNSSPSKRKENFLRLQSANFLYSLEDEVISPSESAAFGFYKPVTSFNESTLSDKLELHELPIYKNDAFGIKTLNERGGVHIRELKNISHTCWVNQNKKNDPEFDEAACAKLYNDVLLPLLMQLPKSLRSEYKDDLNTAVENLSTDVTNE